MKNQNTNSNKRTIYLTILDGIACIIFLILLIIENSVSATGLTALDSVGKWVLFGIGFITTLVIFLILIILSYIKMKSINKKER